MQLKRTLTHLLYSKRQLSKAFSAETLQRIESMIHAAETEHSGEIRFAVEASLDWPALWSGQSARERAIEVFSQLRVWDTEHNNGILIYLLMADRDVEIIADRGIHKHVGATGWEHICHAMEADFRDGKFDAGLETGISAIATHLREHYPDKDKLHNELPDQAVVI